jgi:hypothetical protein
MRPIAKHERFAQLLADGLPQHEAYSKAGLKGKNPRSASTMLLKRNVSIRERVDAILAERREIHEKGKAAAIEEVKITDAWLDARLIDVVEMGLQARPVLNSKGEPIGQFQQNLAAVNRAIELLGREKGKYVERKEVRTGPLDDWDHDDVKGLRDAIIEAKGTIERAAAKRPSRAPH